jgi:hypothetical protein
LTVRATEVSRVSHIGEFVVDIKNSEKSPSIFIFNHFFSFSLFILVAFVGGFILLVLPVRTRSLLHRIQDNKYTLGIHTTHSA